MFTFTKFTKDEINLDARRREMVAEFTDPKADRIHSHSFQFSVNEAPDKIKKVVKTYLDTELNFVPEPVTDLDFTEEATPEPEKTADELAADAWLEKWTEFVAAEKAMNALTRNGITPEPEEKAAFEALKKLVADNRKPQYAHLIANTL